MDYRTFIDSVAKGLGAPPEQALGLTRATLTTLAERIDPGEIRDLSAQLPEELAPYAFAPNPAADGFGLDEFVSRVAGRAETDRTQATDGVRAVFDTLREAVSPAEYDAVVSYLPAEYWKLSGSAAQYGRPGGG